LFFVERLGTGVSSSCDIQAWRRRRRRRRRRASPCDGRDGELEDGSAEAATGKRKQPQTLSRGPGVLFNYRQCMLGKSTPAPPGQKDAGSQGAVGI